MKVSMGSGGGTDTVVRLDSSGQPTYDSWTGNTVQYAYGDMWLAKGSFEVISAPAFLWPWSIWPNPRQNNTWTPIRSIKVNVFKIQEAEVDDNFIRSNVNMAIAYWQMYAGIILDWDGTITSKAGCEPYPPTHPNCLEPYQLYDLTDVTGSETNGTALNEAKRRFWTPKGVTFLFVRSLSSTSNQGITFRGESGPYFNLSILRNYGLDQVTSAHEVGHQFQLFHTGVLPQNLMCGQTNDFLDLSWIPGFCSGTASNELSDDQIKTARASAEALK